MFLKKSKEAVLQIANDGAPKLHIIGNKNAELIVSNRGHFDFLIDKRSVFGKVFDQKDRSFVGKSPVFILAAGKRRIKFKSERVESDHGSITLFSENAVLSFTVDVEKKELLAKVLSKASDREYILCVSGHRISVNSPKFDGVCENLSKITKNERIKHRVGDEDRSAHRLCLFACFWDLAVDIKLSDYYSLEKYKRLISVKRTLCVAFPCEFSKKSLSFAEQLLNYSRYLSSVYELETELCFYDPKHEYTKFFKQNKLTVYSKEEFDLLCVSSVCMIELALDFNSRIICEELIRCAPTPEPKIRKTARGIDGDTLFKIQKGIMKAHIALYGFEKISFSFKDVGELCVCHLDILEKLGDKRVSVFEKAKLQNFGENTAMFCLMNDKSEKVIKAGVDDELPFLLIYTFKNNVDLRFSLKLSGTDLLSGTVRKTNLKYATVLTPWLYEKEKISLFVIKNENDIGASILIGAFLGQNDALLYKAMQKYPSVDSVKEALNKTSRKKDLDKLTCGVGDFVWEDPKHRLAVAQAMCDMDHKKAKACIIWALCTQRVDGSFLCDGSAARALVSYLEKSRDSDILFLELPYTFDGRFTAKRENVFMHVMRAAEYVYNNEDKNALEYLKKLYYEMK